MRSCVYTNIIGIMFLYVSLILFSLPWFIGLEFNFGGGWCGCFLFFDYLVVL